MSGEIMYHSLNSKTDEEKQSLRDKIITREKLREERRKTQEENVKRKQEAKSDHLKSKKRTSFIKKNDYQETNENEFEEADEYSNNTKPSKRVKNN